MDVPASVKAGSDFQSVLLSNDALKFSAGFTPVSSPNLASYSDCSGCQFRPDKVVKRISNLKRIPRRFRGNLPGKGNGNERRNGSHDSYRLGERFCAVRILRC